MFKAQLLLFNHILPVSNSQSKDSHSLFLCCIEGSDHPVFYLPSSIPAEKSHPPIPKSQMCLSAQELSPPIFSCLVAQGIRSSLEAELNAVFYTCLLRACRHSAQPSGKVSRPLFLVERKLFCNTCLTKYYYKACDPFGSSHHFFISKPSSDPWPSSSFSHTGISTTIIATFGFNKIFTAIKFKPSMSCKLLLA